MSKGNTFESELLSHILNNADIANVGDATGVRGSSSAGSLYIALHTADPGEGGSQTTSETSYGSYARVAVARSGAQWSVGSGTGSNAAAITFAVNSSGTPTITHVSIGTASSGAGKILWSGALSSSKSLAVGDQPYFAITGLSVSED